MTKQRTLLSDFGTQFRVRSIGSLTGARRPFFATSGRFEAMDQHNEFDQNNSSMDHGQSHEGHNPENHDQSEAPQQQVVPKRRLGRGLDALLGGGGPSNEPFQNSDSAPTVSEAGIITNLPLDRIQRNPKQPRKHFEKSDLDELASSVGKHGILQPVLVREYGENYELIAGERRWLAARQAGLQNIPCRVVDVIDKIACEFSFEENLKRKDLNDLEKAQAFRDYIDHFESSVEELGKQLSMSRSAVSNTLRLLDLPVPIKNALQEQKLTAGHARAILSLKDEQQQLDLSDRIQKEQLSVRKAEAAVKELLGKPDTVPMTKPEDKPEKPELTNHLKSIEEQLRNSFGVKVELKLKTADSGQVVLHFANQNDFERILESLQSVQSRAA
ncbi:MAG TPA: chromosome partitioning protein ParB [Planctomycetaceae bacterium]|nr:chromosome partitioning protein ParB [Planctomycetaceae bacterium]